MKLDDYSLAKLSNEAENFKEDVQNILNYGKYSAQVVQNTPPAWTARNGEFVFYASGTVKRIYFYNISAWDYIEYNAGDVGGDLAEYVSTNVVFSGVTAITALDYNIGINETYVFEYNLKITGADAPSQAQFRIDAPAGNTTVFLATANSNSLVNIINDNVTASGTFTIGMCGLAGECWAIIRGTVQNGATAGTAQLVMQTANQQGAPTVDAGSFLRAKKII